MDIDDTDSVEEYAGIIKSEVLKMAEITAKLSKITRYETTAYLSGVIIDLNKSSA